MVTKFDIFIEQGLFNHTGVDFVTYYDKRHKMFTARAANARIGMSPVRLIQCDCSFQISSFLQ